MQKRKEEHSARNKFIRCMLSLVLVLGLLPVFPATLLADEGETATETAAEAVAEAATDHILVVFDDSTSAAGDYSTQAVAEAKYTLADKGYAITQTISEASSNFGSIASVDIPADSSVEAAVEEANSISGVAYAQPDYIYRLEEVDTDDSLQASSTVSTDALTNDPVTQIADASQSENQYYLYGNVEEYNVKGANVLEAWDVVQTNQTVTVAVLDTGVNLLHEDLQENLLKDLAWDSYHDTKLEASGSFNGDYMGHGSHVCGIVGATANNGIGIAGASYNAKVLPVKVFTDDSTNPGAYTSDIVSAYEYLFNLVDNGTLTDLHVINMSLGSYSGGTSSDDKSMQAKIAAGVERNILTVCAGGNGDDNNNPVTTPHYPSDFNESFAVTALNADGTNANWSDYNMYKDISAPGVKIYSSLNTGSSSYARYSGTSMASPLVAGIAALLWAADPSATVAEVREAIQESADPIDDPEDVYQRWPNKTGSTGIINAAAALKELNGAYISAPSGFTSLKRTQNVQLSASIKNVSDELTWNWSVQDGTGSARISEDGLLTGITAGTVKVTATTTHNEETFEANLSVEITDIALPARPECTKWYSSAVTVSWTAAEAAQAYQVQRAEQGGAEFVTLATLNADEAIDSAFTYLDYSAEASVLYRYRIVPLGQLDGQKVTGAASAEVSGLRFDMTSTYSSQYSVAGGLVSHLSIDDLSADTVVLAASDNDAALISASGLAGIYNAPVMTITAGATTLNSDLSQALSLINPLRVVVVGNTSGVTESAYTAISELLPYATLARYSASTSEKLAESFYAAGSKVGTWGSTAFVISSDETQVQNAMALCGYAHTLDAPVFTTNAKGTLSVTTLQNLRAGAFERIVIVGSTNAVSAAVETKLNNYGLKCERISAEDPYTMSALLAQDGANNGTYTNKGFGFAQARTANCAQAAALTSKTNIPLILVSDTNLSAATSFISSSTQERIVSYFECDSSLSAASKAKLQNCVNGNTGVYTRGDINNNGVLSIVDAQICYDLVTGVYANESGKYAAFPMPESWSELTLISVADVNFDGQISASDAFAIQYAVLHNGLFGGVVD